MSPATVIPRPRRSNPYSMHPFSPGPYFVHVEETNVPGMRLAPPTSADAIGTQNCQSTWRRLRSPSLYERSGVLNIHRRTRPTESLWKVSVERSEKLIRRGCGKKLGSILRERLSRPWVYAAAAGP